MVTRWGQPKWCWLAALWVPLLAVGCVSHHTEQYFAVKDLETGATNYYRLTIEGGSGAGAKYDMQAGYFSAAAVDVLRGRPPDIPELDLPDDQAKTFNALVQNFSARLLQQSTALLNQGQTLSAPKEAAPAAEGAAAPATKGAATPAAEGAAAPAAQGAAAPAAQGAAAPAAAPAPTPVLATTADFEQQALAIARCVWLGQLSKSDIASVGMTQNVNPYQFRKLVLWANVKNLDLNSLAGDIQASIDSAVGFALAFKKQSDKAAAAPPKE